VRVHLRTPPADPPPRGAPPDTAAVFGPKDRRPRDRDLAAFARAVLAAEQQIATLPPEDLAEKLSKRAVGPGEDVATRLEATREMYLPGGLVSAEQVKQTMALIRAHQPLPATSRVPTPEELLHLEPLRGLSAPAAR
jgi:hypothetical protein